ncbi:sulfatase-like hydrolase/transferase [Halorarius halobius]|uniref:sulfatase-like hydrolase/transferase n=1 Tax=Halorarius halobius TaxID=2962671 RepID=UPI0020CF49AC|nr:sulfatase-like hydrolase/transferase [Halorarius halobius]
MTQNILLVTIDSLRTDHLSLFGHSTAQDGTLTQLGEANISLEHAYATGPGTTPSFPALLTGTLPLSYGGIGPLSDERPRVSESLHEAGLKTGGFQCNPFLSTHFNYDRGFDRFEDYQNPLMGIATKVFPRGIEINNPKLSRVDNIFHITDAIKKSYQLVMGKPRPYVSAEVITDDTLEWLDETNDPFFCWTHYMDVHHPCFPPKPYRQQYGVDHVTQSEVSTLYARMLDDSETLSEDVLTDLRLLYDAAIDYVDDQIGRIIRHLKLSGRFEDTLVIVTSDHGELFGEHDQFGKPERMYDELLHVPVIVANGPNWVEDAIGELVSLLDIPPLIHEVLEIDVPDVYEGQCPAISKPRDYILAEHEVHGDVIVGARSEDWLYEADEIRDEHRLFDLRNDGFQQVSISEHPDVPVRTVVADRLQSLDIDTRRLEDEVEGDVQSRLEDLGYL